jgi:hypothetical protein
VRDRTYHIASFGAVTSVMPICQTPSSATRPRSSAKSRELNENTLRQAEDREYSTLQLDASLILNSGQALLMTSKTSACNRR